MTLGQKRRLFTKLLAEFMLECIELGYEVQLEDVRRTIDQQYLYYKGLSINNDGTFKKVKKATKTMKSKHLEGLAADLNFFKDDVWIQGEDTRVLAELWMSKHPNCNHLGIKYNYDWPHFEFL